jgi:acyl-coenzyme A thioesterase PaaI-like protein
VIGSPPSSEPDRVALQDRFAPHNRCFGCGPANELGLRIKSFVEERPEGPVVVARWSPSAHHEAFPGVMNGGIIGALLDCHSNWCAAHHLMTKAGAASPPCTVTADFHVVLKRPCPMAEVELEARVAESTDDRAVIEATLRAAGAEKLAATCRGTFVAVREGHPAYHRW